MDFTITEDWIKYYATHRCGWTKAQLAVLGVAWPPKKGWLRHVLGRQITDGQRIAFEQEFRRNRAIKEAQTFLCVRAEIEGYI